MKSSILKVIILGFLVVICQGSLQSQQSICTTDRLEVGCPDPTDPDDPLSYLNIENEKVYKFRVTFLEGSHGLLSESECELVMDILESAYSEYGILFVWDRKINVYNFARQDEFQAININVGSGAGGGGAIAIPSTGFGISKDVLFGPVVVHEMGHCLGLLHVHNSSLGDGPGSELTPTCEEFVNSTDPNNSIMCGDCISTTNAITGTNENVSIDEDGNCVYSTSEEDSNDDMYQPNIDTWRNYMSYSNGTNFEFFCNDTFVIEQIYRIKNIAEKSGILDRVRIYSTFEDIPASHDLICLNIDNDILINDDIIIEANTSSNLIGSSEIAVFGNYDISVAENAQAFIKDMVIYNPVDVNWTGFKVRGPGQGMQDDQTGLILSGCTIRGAKNGISQASGDFGGYIEAGGTSFIGCNRGIEMMMYNDQDESVIDDCTFINGKYGVTTWANDIVIEGCTFNNLSIAGIRGIGSSIKVQGNGDINRKDFVNCNYGIRLSWPNGQTESTDITNNYFENNGYDVHVNGGSGIAPEDRTNFVKNQSDNSNVSFAARGENQFSIGRNTFNNSAFWSNLIGNSGEEDNQINLNQYNNSYIANVLFDKNESTFLTANCYSNQASADIYVSGKIPNQGNEFTAPGNCFSGNNIPEISTGYILDNFNYYVPENDVLEYKQCHLVNSSGNFQVEESTDVQVGDNCGVDFATLPTSPSSPGHSPCNPPKNEADLNQAISDIEDLIDEINNNELFSEETKENLIQYYESCLRKVKLWLVEVLVDSDKRQDALRLLKEDLSFSMQIKGYNLLISQNAYTDADAYLNSLRTSSSDQQAYVYAQNIYLDHLTDNSYTPSNNQISTLFLYGSEANVLSGSIRAIYEYFTDEFIELDMIIDGHNPTAPRNNKVSSEKIQAKIYPNPISRGDLLNIDLSRPMEEGNHLNCTTLDLNGNIELQQNIITHNNQIDISSLSTGVYIVRVTDQKGNNITIEKLVIL